MKSKSIYAIVMVIGMLIMGSSVVLAVPTASIVTTTNLPPANKPSSTMTGILTTDKSTYAVGDTIQWTATGLTVGSTYSVWISGVSAQYIVDSSINCFVATSSTMSGTTVYSDSNGALLVIGNMGRWLQYGVIMYDTSTLASVAISNLVTTTTTTSAGSATIIVTVLDSSNHPVTGMLIYVKNVVAHLDSYSINTNSPNGQAIFHNLGGSSTYQVYGDTTNSVTVSFSAPTQTVYVTLHVNPTTTTSSTSSTSSTTSTTTTHPTTTTTTSISTSISGTSTTTTTITKTETETTTTTASNPLSNVKVDPIIAGLGLAVTLVGAVGFIRTPSGKRTRKH